MKKLVLYALLFLTTLGVFAQDTLRTDEIDVIKTFKPTLVDVIKIASNPNPEIPEITVPKLSYTLPQVKQSVIPTLYTIKPLSMGTALLPKLKNNYFKLGYGNYNAPIFEAYISTVRNKKNQAGAFYKHYSVNPTNKDYQSFSNNELNLWAKRFIEKGVINTHINYNRNVIHYYGFDPESLKIPKKDIRRQYGAFDLGVGYSNVTKDTSKLRYQVQSNYYNFSDNNNVSENDFKLQADFSKRIHGNPLQVSVGVNTNNTERSSVKYNRVFVDFNPTYTLNFDNRAHIKIGFNTTLFNDSNGSKFFPYFNGEAAYQIIPKAVTIYGGLTGNYQRNTYRSLVHENPFISQWELRNTSNRVEAFIGLRGEISPQTSFMLQYSRASIQNQLFYGFDSTTFGQATIYDSTNSGLSTIKAELNHEFAEKFHFNFKLNYFAYDLSIDKPFGRPTFTTRTSLMYNMSNKFIFRGDIYTMNSRYGVKLPSNAQQKFDGLVDVNFGIDYRYSKTIGLFLNFNNITNNTYQRWYNYEVLGINILGGITVTF